MWNRMLAALTALLFAGSLAWASGNLALDGNIQGLCGTASATSGAATLANKCGVITSEALTTAAGVQYTLTVTDTSVAAADLCLASVGVGTSTTGWPTLSSVAPAAGSLVIVVTNIHASAALNGTIKISFFCFKP